MTSKGERIKEIRESLGWTQDKLAQEAGISKSFLSEIENNKTSIGGENLLKIANVLDASLDYLMKGELTPNETKPKLVEIPPELSNLAEELGLSHRATLTLLYAYKSLVARRSNKERTVMTKNNWQELYESLKNYLV